MPLLAGITSFFDKYVLGYALGTAAGPALEPFTQDLANAGWELNQVMPLDAGDLAEIVAEDVERRSWGESEASLTGVNAERFGALVGAALNAPGIGQLFEAYRRNLIDDAAFTHGLRKARLEPSWDEPLRALKQRLLSLDELANARQQGFISDARQRSEAALQGIDSERADIQFQLSGLPPGVETAQFAANRGLVDRGTFDQIVREGHTKTKYTDLLWALRQPVLSAQLYATLHLKGWISVAEMNTGGALHGYTPEQMNQMYLSMGRPAAPGYMWTAAARGIDGPAGRPVDEAQFQKAIAESDIRPEYGPMLWGIRYTYPPLFQINRLVQSGAIDAATAVEWATKDRLAPEVVAALGRYWQAGGTSGTDTHVAKAQTMLWGTVHRSFLANESDDADAEAAMTAAGVPADAQPAILDLWKHERALVRKQLTPAQVKKRYRETQITRDDAAAELVARGYSLDDANAYLDL